VPDAARRLWSLTQQSFDGLLALLGPDRDAAAARYLEIRRNLLRLFEWRGCATPEEYADETINRCARKIGDGEIISDPATYCIGIARMLLFEMGRDRARQARPLDEAPEPHVVPHEPESDRDRRVECLRSCLGQLPPDQRTLILRYYQGDKGDKIKNRNRLGQTLGISHATLRMRALRLRGILQRCAENCLLSEGAQVP
jgi:DNA-directed RNA polymerase specialized sigma24 family protein